MALGFRNLWTYAVTVLGILLAAPLFANHQARLQRGAQLYMNYCSGCHSLQYLRYSQLAHGLGLLQENGAVNTPLLFNNLVFTQSAVDDPVVISMPKIDAKQWFGNIPPDLSLVAKARSPDWLYAFLSGFYADPSRPFGTNNRVFLDVAMPNALESLQGIIGADGQLLKKGKLSNVEFSQSVHDLVDFLVYVAEPEKAKRQLIGTFVLCYLGFLLILGYALKKMYGRKLIKNRSQSHSR